MARIETATTGAKRPGAPHRAPDSLLDDAFGIFTGAISYHAKIAFTGTAAELIRRQFWHKNQTIEERDDGIVLSLPVNDAREIIMKILQYGSRAKVLAPESLRKRVIEEIQKMSNCYQA